jgi:hypothetical protein
MPETDIEVENDHQEASSEPSVPEPSLVEAKLRFSKAEQETLPPGPDLSTAPPIVPVISDLARENQHLKNQLHDAERMSVRAQKAASEYREQLTEAQADIAAMKSRWYAAEKARNAVSSQREADSSTINGQLLRAQKELERAQQSARSDMERAAARIQVLEERLETALNSAAQAESSQVQYRKRSNIFLSGAVVAAVVCGGVLIYELLPHRAPDPSLAEASLSDVRSARQRAPINLENISRKPFVPHAVTKSLPDALGRLDRALKGFPGLEQEAVLQQVQRRQSKPGQPVCSFDWSNGQPSMAFGQGSHGISAESWAISISQCADALEQAH